MGPRFFKRGELTNTFRSASVTTLQWGHAFSSVERGLSMFLQAQVPELQWGHAFSSVESLCSCALCSSPGVLQWGHAFSSVESSMPPPRLSGHVRFNGATLFQAWRESDTAASSPRTTWLQWGHAFSSVESCGISAPSRAICSLQWGHAFSSVESRPPSITVP